MAGFTLFITPVVTANDLSHFATSWQISKDPLFNDVLVDKEKDKDNLLSLKVDLPLTKDDVYYSRHKLHFKDNDGNEKETNWSRPSTITKNSDGFSFNNTIITTPRVFTEISNQNCPLGGFNIYAGKFNLFMGVGKHESTDWIIEDSEGNIIWERLNDKNNLTKIRIPANILNAGRLYVVKVRFNSDTNSSSNYGKLLLITDPKLTKENTDIDINYVKKIEESNVYLAERLKCLENIEKTANDLLTKLVACTIDSTL